MVLSFLMRDGDKRITKERFTQGWALDASLHQASLALHMAFGANVPRVHGFSPSVTRMVFVDVNLGRVIRQKRRGIVVLD